VTNRVTLQSSIVCGGCRYSPPDDDPYPFRCRNAGDGGDHVLRRVLDLSEVSYPAVELDENNPFVAYRQLMHSYHLATAGGLSDDAYVEMVRSLDAEVARIDGAGFMVSPLTSEHALAESIGSGNDLWVKNETGSVSGSHKARHLFGILLHLEVVDRLGLARSAEQTLAIASCGNAALAAGVLAAAAGRRLQVFVPPAAPAGVVARLGELGADVVTCERQAGIEGDPTYLRLLEALDAGALPFTCQGNLNGLAIEGGETIGWEMASVLTAVSAPVDHVVVQVGGGALASAVAQSLREAVDLDAFRSMPRFHTVQSEGAWPLRRAYDRVTALLPAIPEADQVMAVLREAETDRAVFMWPWESTPHSVAEGILDDETYDWLAVVEAMLSTRGQAVVVGEERLLLANSLAVESSGINVDETGSAGLAGLMQLIMDGAIGPDEPAAVLFTGVRREP
jgi:threonine synthase